MVLKNMVHWLTNHTPHKLDILADFLSFFLQIICTGQEGQLEMIYSHWKHVRNFGTNKKKIIVTVKVDTTKQSCEFIQKKHEHLVMVWVSLFLDFGFSLCPFV